MTEGTKNTLLQVARDAIKEEIIDRQLINREILIANNVELDVKRPCFVILTKRHDKNPIGCIGSIQPTISILDEVIKNSKMSASVGNVQTETELETLKIEVALISPIKEVLFTDREEIRHKFSDKDGVILSKDKQIAAFLPDIWEEVKDYNGLVSTLISGVDIKNDEFEDCQIFKFQVTERFND